MSWALRLLAIASAPRLTLGVGDKSILAGICFACLKGYLCEVGKGSDVADLHLAQAPEKTFDLIFAKYRLPKAL